MKWPAILVSTSIAILGAVLLILLGMHLGQKATPQPLAQAAPPAAAVPAAPIPAPRPAFNRGPAQVARGTPPRPAAPTPTPALAGSALLSQPGVLTGTLRTVDASGAIGYLPLDSDINAPTSVTPKGLLVNQSTQITLDGKTADLGALRPGMDIAFMDAGDNPLDKLEAFAIVPDGKAHIKRGPIDKITATEIVFLAGRKDLFPVALTLASDTPTTIDGKPAKPSDLRYRMFASVNYLGLDAQTIAASTVILDGAAHHADGNLVSADADGVTIRVYGNAGFDVVLKTAPAFKIQRETGRAQQPDLVDAALADLRAGQHVVATYTSGTAADITIKLGGGTTPARGRAPAGRPVAVPATRGSLP